MEGLEKPNLVSHKNIWILISSIIVTALIVGFGVYFFQQSINKEHEQEVFSFIAKIEKLQQDPRFITEKTIIPTNPSIFPAHVFTERTLLTQENKDMYNNIEDVKFSCGQNFNLDPALETVSYKNNQKGLEIKIPYNPAWGNEQFRISPFEESKDGIEFGPILSDGEGDCLWPRMHYITFKPQRSAEAVIAALEVENSNAQTFVVAPKIVQLGEIQAVMYVYDGLCAGGGFEVIGIKSNYFISRICMMTGEELEELKPVVNSIKLK